MKTNQKADDPPTKKLSHYVFWFVASCFLINWAVKLLLEVWWVLVVIATLIIFATALLRFKRWKDWR